MKLIKNWEVRPLRCFFCGRSTEVKYEVENPEVGHIVYSCSECILQKQGTLVEEDEE